MRYSPIPWLDYALASPRWDPTLLWAGGALAGCWMDLDASGAITRNTQPTPDDWDMEAVGTASWTPSGASGSLAKDAAIKYAGLRSLAVTTTGAGNYYAYQSPLITGNRYDLSGWHRHVNACNVYLGLSTLFVIPGTSGAWAQLAEAGEATDARLFLGASNLDTSYYDDIALVNKSIASVTCTGTLGNVAQSTAARMPYEKALGSRLSTYVAIGDGLVLGTTKSTQRHFHDGTGVTMSLVANLDALAATRTLAASADVATSAGFSITVATNGALTYSVHNTVAGTPYLTCTSSAGAIAAGTKAIVRVVMSTAGDYVYVNGALVASDLTTAGSPSVGDATNLIKIGGKASDYTAGAVGQIADFYSAAKVVSASEGTALDQYFAAKHGITLP